jgi:phage RecT family recombinase
MAEQKKQTNALITMIDAKREGLWNLKASYLPKINQEVYFKRALITVMESKELAALAKTEIGALSILKAIGKALQMGLQIGGNIPQAYIVKFGETAGLIPTAEGYQFICTTEPDQILKSFDVRAVYDGEDFAIDYSAGTVKHTFSGGKRGKLSGVYCRCEDMDGNKMVGYYTREDLERVRDTKSRYFMSTKKGPWLDDFDAMCKKTAAKNFLKPFSSKKEGLAMALAVDDGEPVRDNRPIQSRVGDQLDDVLDAEFEPAESTPPPKQDQASDQKEQKKGNAPF